nr:hypothetical protein [uncultured Steroidobacter sp.]
MPSLVIRPAARFLTARVAFSCIALAVLGACNRGGEPTTALPSEPAELTWARAALERNPRYEVLASDTQTRVFTVRDRSTGQVQTINLNDLAAAPLAQLKSPPPAVSAPLPAPAPEASSAAVPPTPPGSSATPPSVGPAASPPASAAESAPAAKVVDNSPAAAAERAQAAETNYTIDRSGGTLRVSGPGVSIVSTGRGEASGQSNAAGVRASEPIICEGKRMLKLDDRKMYVEGDAIIARGGCELYITNSTIVATGTGLIVEDAIVHVANSHIEGLNGSFNATDRARMFVRTSTFQGVPRRAEFASVLDQGGNQWR